jgi:hypothetical protein
MYHIFFQIVVFKISRSGFKTSDQVQGIKVLKRAEAGSDERDSSPQRPRVRKGFYQEIFSLRALRLRGEPYKIDRIRFLRNCQTMYPGGLR